jgi:hypothetical protein
MSIFDSNKPFKMLSKAGRLAKLGSKALMDGEENCFGKQKTYIASDEVQCKFVTLFHSPKIKHP